MKILVVDDELEVLTIIQLGLMRAGYEVITASNAALALQLLAKEKPALAVLDVMMPDMDGYDLVQAIRQRSNMPILMLTAKGSVAGEVASLELGADDYITKPFSMENLVAHIKALLRRSGENDQVLRRGPLALSRTERRVFCDTIQLKLRPLEYELLALMMERPRHLFTREELYQEVWGKDYHEGERGLDVVVASVRRKLGKHDCLIQTEHGIGYRLEV
ncbi:MAG: response regulator transcription factor [Chloroflexi bacterium]|nr:response regulator transcription factor [Chloroflexota bacterium]MBI5714485.1 response regulator transcription factor [Chloroflexota bacterium]